MKVMEVMHKGVSSVKPNATLKQIAVILNEEDIGAIPVIEGDEAIGIITDRDIVCRSLAEGKDPANLSARDVMSTNIKYCTENEDIDDAIRIMEQNEVRRLPVMNDDKQIVGMLSLGDISHSLPQDLAGEVIRAVSDHHE